MTVFRLSYDGSISYLCGATVWLPLLSRADFPVGVSTGGNRIDEVLGASIKSYILSLAFSKVFDVDRPGFNTRPAEGVGQAPSS